MVRVHFVNIKVFKLSGKPVSATQGCVVDVVGVLL